jgi:hypothetical protein
VSKSRQYRGNFEDLRSLLDELDKPLLIEVREPSSTMRLLCEKLARCPAAHNRILLDEAEQA